MNLTAIKWNSDHLTLLDQRLLPTKIEWIDLFTPTQVAQAISDMVVRGAPAIGITAAYGMALAIKTGVDRPAAAAQLLAARPTAVNLRWALERVENLGDDAIEETAIAIHQEDIANNRALGDHGKSLLREGGVITICNAGALATGGWGTALGVIRSAWNHNPNIHVYALETRPYLQGARLTAFECAQEDIPCTLITDGMAGALLATGRVHAAIVGCDRVAANGDTANKIGTYQLAVVCAHHNIPLFVAMPTSTLDTRCETGKDIPVEHRDPSEVSDFRGTPIAPDGICVWNPSFDITPAHLIAGWVTENGMWSPPGRSPFDVETGNDR